MALTPKDIKHISDILKSENSKLFKKIDKKFEGVNGQLIKIEKRLEAIEKWVPVANSNLPLLGKPLIKEQARV